MIHVIKSFNRRRQGSIPKTLQNIRNQLAAALRMIHNLASKDDHGVGGFRIEVTVKAKSLQEAHQLVNDTGFLDPSSWLKAGNGHVAWRGLTAKLVTREGLLANAKWVYDQAAQSDIFTGAAADKPSNQQIQAIVDMLNALGWNAGIRRPTKSLDPNAWWNATLSTDRANIFRQLIANYQSDDQIRELFQRAKENAKFNALPCKEEPGNQDHRYQIHKSFPSSMLRQRLR